MTNSFFSTLFSNNFLPHGHCYFWRPDILWLNVISDASIAIAYYAIPIILLAFMFKRKDFPFPWVLVMFGAFILLCGTTHIMGIVTIWDPLYSLDGVIKAGTAAVSVLTTLMLIPLIPLALALKSPKELEAANVKLAEANEKLKEIDRLKDNFFSNISHELRTPLTLILAPLESFLSHDYGELSDVQRKNLEAMHNNSIRLFQMVNSILDFAKISAKKIEVKREPLDILLLTQSIANEFTSVLNQKNIKLDFNCDSPKKIVDMDRYLYERILFNLLSNAAKFTPENGAIFISLTCDQDRLKLAIKDTGIGISEADQKNLFQRFQQVEGSSTRRFEGTGLGLALVKEFAILLGGDVTVDSQVNQGSTFLVEIKAPESTTNAETGLKPLTTRFQKYDTSIPTPISETSAIKTSEQDTPKILIAEDNVELATYVASLLSEFANTKHASDGEEAWNMITSWHPDLVLLDVMMPKRDGISICREIKSSAKTAHIPVILLTALTHRDALLRGWEAGADEYLFKPFHPRELVTRIKLLLKYAENNNLLLELNRKLVISARLTGISEVVTNVLHSLGNVLNSVNVRTNHLLEIVTKSHIKDLSQLIHWLEEALSNPNAFINDKQKQTDLFNYLNELNHTLLKEQEEWLENIETINKYNKDVIAIIHQQKITDELYGIIETVNLPELADEILDENLDNTENIQVIKKYNNVPKITIDKMRLREILMNLVCNAKESLQQSQKTDKKLYLSFDTKTENERNWIEIEVSDNGIGIPPENLNKIFTFGFSTKSAGRGFGLHVSNLSAKKMGGKLMVKSSEQNGTTFSLLLPCEPFEITKWIKV